MNIDLNISIPESKYKFFVELINNLGFATISEQNSEVYQNVKQGLKEVKEIELGKLSSRPAKDFLDEL